MIVVFIMSLLPLAVGSFELVIYWRVRCETWQEAICRMMQMRLDAWSISIHSSAPAYVLIRLGALGAYLMHNCACWPTVVYWRCSVVVRKCPADLAAWNEASSIIIPPALPSIHSALLFNATKSCSTNLRFIAIAFGV